MCYHINMNKLKELRLSLDMSQVEAAESLHISRRSYQMYEVLNKPNNKYEYLVERLSKLALIDEEHGLLTIEKIKNIVNDILPKYECSLCYLFGSYAKGYAKENSDVDLLIDTTVTGIKYFGLVEELRNALHKKVDVVLLRQLDNNLPLVKEILNSGIKIYQKQSA